MTFEPAGLRHRPLAYVADLERPVLSDGDYRHLDRVLRVGPGDPVTLGDGRGRWREARFGRRPEPVSEIRVAPTEAPAITIAFTPVKGERADWIVQKLTELGVDRIVPVLTTRSVVRWDEQRAARQHERMVRVAREACLQSRRLRRPTVDPLVPIEMFLSAEPDAVLADPGGRPMGHADRVVIVGPEGGFTAEEWAMAPAVRLPGHVLRAETAAMVAGVVACGFRADLFG